MRIGQLALLSQLPASTIRYYEQKGLLPHARRNQSGYRDYDDEALSRLNLIKFSQSLGFSLDEMPRLIEQDGKWDHQLLLYRLEEKHKEAEMLITQLQNNQAHLAELIGRLKEVWKNGQCMSQEELNQIINSSNSK